MNATSPRLALALVAVLTSLASDKIRTAQLRDAPKLQHNSNSNSNSTTVAPAARLSLRSQISCAARASCQQRPMLLLPAESARDLSSCKCDPKCVQYGDCCADFNFVAASHKTTIRGDVMGAKMDAREARAKWQCRRVNRVFGDVLMRSKCAHDWLRASTETSQQEAEFVQQRCENSSLADKSTAEDPLGLMMPVTDLTTGTTFINSYCVRCNPRRLETARLKFWTPLLECNYSIDQDDRKTLIDLISTRRGSVLEYSRTRHKWLVRGSTSTTQTPSDAGTPPPPPPRECTITPIIPTSAEHLVRFCRMRLISACAQDNDATQQIREDCHYGFRSLVYSQTSDKAYHNVACALCNGEPQTSCEPRANKPLGGGVSRVVAGDTLEITDAAGNHSSSSADAGPFAEPADDSMLPLDASGDTREAAARSGSVADTHSVRGSLSVLMDLSYADDDDGVEYVGSKHRCGNSPRQVFDPFFLTCRCVVCGLNRRLLDGKCVPTNLSTRANNLQEPAHSDAAHLGGATSAGELLDVGESAPTQAQSAPSQGSPQQQVSRAQQSSNALPLVSFAASSSTNTQKLEQPTGSPQIVTTTTAQQQSAFDSWASNVHDASELPKPSEQSRRRFTECAKILIERQHYHLFVAQNRESNSTTTTTTTNSTANIELVALRSGAHENHSATQIWAYVAPYNLTLDSSQFELVRAHASRPEDGELSLLMCSPFANDLVDKFTPLMVWMTNVCLAISIASLTLYLLLYVLSTLDLRRISANSEHADVEWRASHERSEQHHHHHQGSATSTHSMSSSQCTASRSQSLSTRGVACLAAALLAAYLLFIVGHQTAATSQLDAQEIGQNTPTACLIVALATFFFFLVAFNWMFLLSYDIWRTLRLATCQLRAPASHSQSGRFCGYALFALLAAGLVVAAALALDIAPLECALTTDSQHLQLHHNDHVSCNTNHTNYFHDTIYQDVPNNSSCSPALTQFSSWAQLYRPKFGQRPGSCWFANRRSLALFFGLPVALIMLANVLFFFHSSLMVIRTSTRSKRQANKKSSTSSGCYHDPPKITRLDSSISAQSNDSAMTNQQYSQSEDYTFQNSLTTSSILSVQTLHSQLGHTSSSASSISSTSGDSSAEDSSQELQAATGAHTHEPNAPPATQHDKKLQKKTSFAGLSTTSSNTNHHNSLSVSLSNALKSAEHLHLQTLGVLMHSIVQDYKLYARLSTIMGLTWLTGLLASLVDAQPLWYLFVVLNSLQGLFIFIAFGCKRSKLDNAYVLAQYTHVKWRAWTCR